MKFLICLLLASSAFAAVPQYDIKMDINVEGKRFVSQNLVLKEGETTTIFEEHGNEEHFLQVEALDNLHMKMQVGKIGPNGERIIISSPEVIARENQAMKMETNDMKLEMTAKRKVQ